MPPRPLTYVPIEAGCAHLAFWSVYPLGRKGKISILKSWGQLSRVDSRMPLFGIYLIPPGQVWQKRVGDWVVVRAPVAYMFDCRCGVGKDRGSSM